MSPPLVVAFALAGKMIDMYKEPLGHGKDGKPVYLKDMWPTQKEVDDAMASSITPEMFRSTYKRTCSRATRAGRGLRSRGRTPTRGTPTRPT
jgi:aconitase A